jgi:hypothetical protein
MFKAPVMIEALMPFLILLAVPCFFLVALRQQANGGWSALAAKYKNEMPFAGPMIKPFFGGRVNSKAYGQLKLGVGSEGLHIDLSRPFGYPWHPPLLIPWREISSRTNDLFLGIAFAELTFSQVPDVVVSISPSAWRRVESAAAEVGLPSPP